MANVTVAKIKELLLDKSSQTHLSNMNFSGLDLSGLDFSGMTMPPPTSATSR